MPGRIEGFPDLVGLALLTEIASAGSVGAAAERLGVSQPAASQRIRNLERDLGIPLIERRATGSRLTPAGTVIVEWAAPLLAEAAEFSASAAILPADRANRMKVAASFTIADYLLPGWLLSLRQLLPDLSVSLQLGNSDGVTRAVKAGEAELGFVEGPDAPHGVRSRVVADDELVVVVAPNHPWAVRGGAGDRHRGAPLSATELAIAPLVLREETSGTRRVFDVALAAHSLEAAPVMELGSTSAIKQAVASGAYATVLSRLAVERELAAGDLVALRVDGMSLARKLRAIWRAATPPRGAAGALLTISAR